MENIGNKAKGLIELNKIVAVPPFQIIERQLENYLINLSGELFSVRSSSVNEDNSGNTNAGLFKTFLNVPKEELNEKINEVFKSIGKGSVIVQEMIIGDYSGVFFSNRFKEGENLLTLTDGLCEKIVSGKTTPDTFFIEDGKITKKFPSPDNNTQYTEDDIIKINSLMDWLKSHFQDKLDIEFTVKDNTVYFLQMRELY